MLRKSRKKSLGRIAAEYGSNDLSRFARLFVRTRGAYASEALHSRSED
jgi:hypothetical protein